eukprot:scaffold90477_cov41-Tisochrysis_lutea.AAC.1
MIPSLWCCTFCAAAHAIANQRARFAFIARIYCSPRVLPRFHSVPHSGYASSTTSRGTVIRDRDSTVEVKLFLYS